MDSYVGGKTNACHTIQTTWLLVIALSCLVSKRWGNGFLLGIFGCHFDPNATKTDSIL